MRKPRALVRSSRLLLASKVSGMVFSGIDHEADRVVVQHPLAVHRVGPRPGVGRRDLSARRGPGQRAGGDLAPVDEPFEVDRRARQRPLVDDVRGEGDDLTGRGPAPLVLGAGAQDRDARDAVRIVDAVGAVHRRAVDEGHIQVDAGRRRGRGRPSRRGGAGHALPRVTRARIGLVGAQRGRVVGLATLDGRCERAGHRVAG